MELHVKKQNVTNKPLRLLDILTPCVQLLASCSLPRRRGLPLATMASCAPPPAPSPDTADGASSPTKVDQTKN
uniref:Uncharacterized protein n=1 Tax=Oryza nivara TaxID=4536 RepID=A0A0E0FKG3_ORYNI